VGIGLKDQLPKGRKPPTNNNNKPAFAGKQTSSTGLAPAWNSISNIELDASRDRSGLFSQSYAFCLLS
jgi:hypothetical protein